jgi:hypothetical protein
VFDESLFFLRFLSSLAEKDEAKQHYRAGTNLVNNTMQTEAAKQGKETLS